MSQIRTARLTRMRKAFCWLVVPAVLTAIADGPAAEVELPKVDKGAFHLFNPTPSQYLRELSVDGPGTTESAYTVDAGHFQFELTLASYTFDHEPSDGVTQRLDAWAIAPITLKVGLLNQLDAQLVLETYNLAYEREDGSRVTGRGFGDTAVRLKYNVWGNDRGRTAFAAMPYVKFPTSAKSLGNTGVEGGIILPFEAVLPRDFYVGLTPRFVAVRDEDERGYHAEFMNSVAFGHDLGGKLFGYVEFSSMVSTERDVPWSGTFGSGLIYELTRNIQLNVGVNIGVTRSADDWNPFIGLAWRF